MLKKIALSVFLIGVCLTLIFVIMKVLKVQEPFVDFSNSKQNSMIKSNSTTRSTSLRFAVATMWSVKSTFSMYRRLVQRIGRDVGLEESFILRSSYRALRRALEQGEVDIAVVCTGPYVYALPSGQIELLVQPVFKDGHQYHSVLIVPHEISNSSVEDLRGTVMGFSDPESFTGCIVPYLMLTEQGLNPKTFFQEIIFTGSHDHTIHAVDRGIVNVAAVHSIVWESAKREDPSLLERLKVIWESETFGPPPVIVLKDLDENLKNSLQNAFLMLDKDEEGRQILSAIGIERFIPAREDDYQTAVELYKRYEQLGDTNWP